MLYWTTLLTPSISVHFVFNIIWPICILVSQMSCSRKFYQHKLELHMTPYQELPFCHHSLLPCQHHCLRYQNRSQQLVSSYVNGCPQHQNRWHHSAPHVSVSCTRQSCYKLNTHGTCNQSALLWPPSNFIQTDDNAAKLHPKAFQLKFLPEDQPPSTGCSLIFHSSSR
jgi:hypothetical protein